MLLSPAVLPHLSSTAFRNSTSATAAAAVVPETDQPPTTSESVMQCAMVNELIKNGATTTAATITKTNDNSAVDSYNDANAQTDLIEAITFASLYGFQAVPIRIKILLHRALSTLSRKRAEAIIRRTGWKVDDFERGFIQVTAVHPAQVLGASPSEQQQLQLITASPPEDFDED